MLIPELAYWINERYSMKMLREEGLPPEEWSKDAVMRETRWCNVHREDDAVTKWLAEHWRPKHHAAWEIVLARMVNYTPSLEVLLGYIDHLQVLRECAQALKRRRDEGEKVFTSAYTISTCGQRMDKIDYVINVVASVMIVEGGDWPAYDSLEQCHRQLMQANGLGSFLAAQVVADLKNTAGHPLRTAPDWWTWAAPGPGSLRGLTAFYGRPITPAMFEASITECWKEVFPHINPAVPKIHMQDFQNCLCEFSKYMKITRGEGHARNKYRPRTD